ncbi:MAG: glycosyl hydrolase family 65 protein [Nocardioidaceae bacterium]
MGIQGGATIAILSGMGSLYPSGTPATQPPMAACRAAMARHRAKVWFPSAMAELPARLERRLEAVLFGLERAGGGERAETTRARRLVEDCCRHGIHVALVCGEGVAEADARLAARPPADAPGLLLLLAPDSPSVFRVDETGPRELPARDRTSSVEAALAELGRLGIGRGELALATDGAAPSGAPAEGAVELAGGLDVLGAVLEDQLARRADPPERDVPPSWAISVPELRPERERADEAQLEFGDGRVSVAGAPLVEHPRAEPGVKAPGVFFKEDSGTDLVPLPDCNRLGLAHREGMEVSRTLDMRDGLLYQRIRDGSRELRAVTFCSLARPGTVVLRAAGDEELIGHGAPLRIPRVGDRPEDVFPALVYCSLDQPGYVVLRDSAERAEVEPAEWRQVIATRGMPGGAVAAARQLRVGGRLDRVTAHALDQLTMPRDRPALARLEDAEAAGYARLLAEQREAWARRWESCDIRIEGDDELQHAVRFAMFHLMALAASEGDTAVGARGTTGHAYRGHVFWDVECFVLPFFAATHPPSARSMLRYRARRLDAAKANAAWHGYAGARFPWESAASGHEVTPRWMVDHNGDFIEVLTGMLEEHVTADVAWAAGQYLAWTGDEEFARGDGMALLVETARYWASRVERDPDGSGHLRDVIGPDEYHEHVDDNAYTNVMARWNLRAAAAHADRYGGGVSADELERWRELADAIVDNYRPESGLYEQFTGFFELEPVIAASLAERPLSATQLVGYDRTHAGQFVKQTDVLMLHLNVPEETAPGSFLPNLEFYEPRTTHESSLSPGSSAEALARAGRPDEALPWLRTSAFLDLPDHRPVTKPGLHTAALGNTWRAVAFGLMGLRPEGDALRVDPRLPSSWGALELRVRFRGAIVRLRAEDGRLTVHADAPVLVAVGDGAPAAVDAGELSVGLR